MTHADEMRRGTYLGNARQRAKGALYRAIHATESMLSQLQSAGVEDHHHLPLGLRSVRAQLDNMKTVAMGTNGLEVDSTSICDAIKRLLETFPGEIHHLTLPNTYVGDEATWTFFRFALDAQVQELRGTVGVVRHTFSLARRYAEESSPVR